MRRVAAVPQAELLEAKTAIRAAQHAEETGQRMTELLQISSALSASGLHAGPQHSVATGLRKVAAAVLSQQVDAAVLHARMTSVCAVVDREVRVTIVCSRSLVVVRAALWYGELQKQSARRAFPLSLSHPHRASSLILLPSLLSSTSLLPPLIITSAGL